MNTSAWIEVVDRGEATASAEARDSIYVLLAEPIQRKTDGPPETAFTESVETIDRDVIAMTLRPGLSPS